MFPHLQMWRTPRRLYGSCRLSQAAALFSTVPECASFFRNFLCFFFSIELPALDRPLVLFSSLHVLHVPWGAGRATIHYLYQSHRAGSNARRVLLHGRIERTMETSLRPKGCSSLVLLLQLYRADVEYIQNAVHWCSPGARDGLLMDVLKKQCSLEDAGFECLFSRASLRLYSAERIDEGYWASLRKPKFWETATHDRSRL